MISKIRHFIGRGALALCLAAGMTAQTLEPAVAAPITVMSSAAVSAGPELLQKAYYHRYRVRRYRRAYFRPRHYYRPIYAPVCRRFVGWHPTRFGMVFGPYRRCYRGY